MSIEDAVTKRDNNGTLVESHINSVIIFEEASSDALIKPIGPEKTRFLAIVAALDNRVLLKKGRQDNSGNFQVGRTWDLAELSKLQSVGENGVIAVIGKQYYWRFRNAAEKKKFCGNLNLCYYKYCGRNIPERLHWDAPTWTGIWDRAQGGSPSAQQQMRVPKQRDPPSMNNWSNNMSNDTRYGPGRVSQHDLTRRPSRGPNSPVSPVIPSPEIPQIPELGPKQRYRPQQHQNPPQPPIPSSTSHSSLRSRQQHQFQQSSYGQPPSQQRLSDPQSGKAAPPYPISPVVGAFPHSKGDNAVKGPVEQRQHQSFAPPPNSAHRGSRGNIENKSSAATRENISQPPPSREDLERRRRGSQGVDNQGRPNTGPSSTMPLNVGKSTPPLPQKQYPSRPVEPVTQHQKPSTPKYSNTRQLNSSETAPVPAVQALQNVRNSRGSASGPSSTGVAGAVGAGIGGVAGLSSARSSRTSASINNSGPSMPPNTVTVPPQRPDSPEHSETPALPSQSPARSHRKQQRSDASDASFMSARDDMSIHEAASQHVRDGSMHHNISLTQASPLEQPFREVPSSRQSIQSFDELPTVEEAGTPRRESREVAFSPKAALHLKKINRLSPAKLGLSSPRRSKQFSAINSHVRNPSNVSVSSVRSHTGDDEAYGDLKSVLTQLQYTGDEAYEDLEKKINGRITQANETQVAAVASLDDKLDQLDALLAESIEECSSLTDTLASVAVNLATIGPEISSIENKSEGSQVLDMNKRMLVSEIERLLEGIQFSKESEVFLVRTQFTSEELPDLESNLLKLYGPFQILNSSTNTVMVAQDLVNRISTTAETFNLNFIAFMKQRINGILHSDTTDGLSRIDAEVLRQLYPYNAIVLFTKETNQGAYKKLVSYYEDEVKHHLNESLPPFTITWKRKLESATGSRPKFSFKSQGRLKAADENQSTTSLKRGMSVKVGSHSVGLKSDSNKYQHKALPLKGPDSTTLATINSSFDEFVDTYSEQIAAQQQVMVNLFHLSSSSGRKYDIYVHQVPLRVRKEAASRFGGRPQVLETDSSRKVAQALHKILSKMFSSAEEQVRQVAELVSNTCMLQAVYLIGKLEMKLEALANTDQDYTRQLWMRLRDLLVPHWRKFIENQSRFILDTHINISKRVGIIPVAEAFVTYVNSVEASMIALGDNAPKTRKLVNESHGQIFRAITQVFSRSSQPMHSQSSVSLSTQTENKEELNFHVTMIENLYVITQGLMKADNPEVIDSVLTEARTRYRRELEAYIADVEQRPLGRILEFLPKSNGQTPKFKVSTFKKVVSSYDVKEMRKNVDVLRKRVQKHFGDESADGVLVSKVWSAISAEFDLKFSKIIAVAKQNEVENLVPLTRQEVRETMQSFA